MNKLWMLLLSLLGFAGCDEPQEDMYGTPYAEYTVKGRVTDAAGTPIAGIEVRRSSWGSDPSAVRTDTRGAYTFEADGNVLYMPPVLTFTCLKPVLFSSVISTRACAEAVLRQPVGGVICTANFASAAGSAVPNISTPN